MTLYFKTDEERQLALDDAFGITADSPVSPNAREFYERHLVPLDWERMGHLIELVGHAKAAYAVPNKQS